jgi:hypothetical protein
VAREDLAELIGAPADPLADPIFAVPPAGPPRGGEREAAPAPVGAGSAAAPGSWPRPPAHERVAELRAQAGVGTVRRSAWASSHQTCRNSTTFVSVCCTRHSKRKTRVAGLSLGVSAQRCAFASLQIDSLLCVVCVNLVDSVDLLFRKLQYASGACTAPQRHPLDLCMEPRSGAPSASGVQASVRVPGRPALARRPNRAPRGAQALRPSPAACATAPAAGAGMPGPAPAVASPPAPASAAAAPDPGSASLLQVRAVLARTTSTYPRHVHSW